jgi:ferric-dicitrate binding protein FerR (iron transport regulator)
MHLDEEDDLELERLLRTVDSVPPRVDPEQLAQRARARKRTPRWTRWAAGVALIIGLGGVAYAIPGSPVRPWVDRLLAVIGGGGPEPERPAPLPPVAPGDAAGSGIAVDPGPDLIIVFVGPKAGARARILLSEGTQVRVQAPAGRASYTHGLDRLGVELLADSVEVEIHIPRSAPRVAVRVGDREVFRKQGSRIVTPVPLAGQAYSIPLSQIPR